ncbi:MAG TPA: hypothetical protein VEX69_06000 [Candidatus Limnocylindria bacterium]|nr:hypothetical protein [Candidatus Limnocylindria bacterium]
MTKPMIKLPFLAAAILLIVAGALAQSNPPSDKSASSVPAPAQASAGREDRHEGLSIVADPYTDAGRAKEKFGKANPLAVGILPIEVFIRNESPQPIRIDLNTVQLEVRMHSGPRQDIDWLTADEVAKAIAHPSGARDPTRRRLPVPVPIPGKDKNVQKLADILGPLALGDDMIAPKSSVHGFLYFDVNHDVSIVSKSSLYIPDVVIVPGNKVMMFFDVPLGGEQ